MLVKRQEGERRRSVSANLRTCEAHALEEAVGCSTRLQRRRGMCTEFCFYSLNAPENCYKTKIIFVHLLSYKFCLIEPSQTSWHCRRLPFLSLPLLTAVELPFAHSRQCQVPDHILFDKQQVTVLVDAVASQHISFVL